MKKFIILISVGLTSLLACKKAEQPDTKKTISSRAFASGTALRTIYYVDPSGSDDSTGTSPETAWKTLSKINSATFSPGDQILFKSGSVWNDTLHIKNSGSAEAPIIIDKYGGDARPVINGGGKRNGSNTLYLNRASYCEVNNLEITNTVPVGVTYTAAGIRINGGWDSNIATGISIKNCYIHHINAAKDGQPNFNKATGGIIIDGKVSNVLVQSCHIANCSVAGMRTTGSVTNIVFDNNLLEYIYGDGIIVAGATGGCKVIHNTVYKACMNTTDYNYAGIWTVGSKNTLVAYNEVYGMTGGGSNDGMAFDADGYSAGTLTDGDIFEYNYSHDNNGGFMLFMWNSQNITVRYNVSVNDIGTTGKKKLFLFDGAPSTRNHQIYNNVFYIKNPGGIIFYNSPYGVYSNNIFYAAPTATNLRLSDQGLTTHARFNNNNFYPHNVFTAFNWGTSQLSNNFYSDPSFVNPVAGNGFSTANGYNVSVNSASRNAGVFISNNGGKDFSGNALPGTGNPDVGAFQHAVISQAGSTLADAYVRNGSYAGTNYGTSSDLIIKSDATSYNRKAYVKFDISAVTRPKVSSGILKMYVSAVNTSPQRTINVYTTNTTSWMENTITWNNAPMDTVLAGKFVVTGTGIQTIDVTNAINRQLTSANRNMSFLFLNTGAFSSTGDMTFSSKEAATNKPVLQLQY